ncbi:hypothetical protein COSO111634_27195 [Corallococcus soli]
MTLLPGRSRSANPTGRQVTCTVVSVMPYMFTSWGRASP